ncbi:MAG: hypothetical protein V1765_02705 [bacterium]
MQKKLNQVPRLLVILILGLTITVLGFVVYMSSVTKAQAQTTYPQVGFGLYKSPYSPAVAGDKIGSITPKLQKLREKCLATKDCIDDTDCTFFDCISGDPDEEAILDGDCINNKCVCNDAVIDRTPCPESLPKCHTVTDGTGNVTGTKCTQCNGPSDCETKESICKDENTLVNYEPTCDGHKCSFNEVEQKCLSGCATVDGEAKCVGCLKDSQCPTKKDTCKNAYIKTSWQPKCNNNVCDYEEKSNLDCQKYKPAQFCYQKPNNDFATCVSCFADEQCGETRSPKCNKDRKSYNTVAWKCTNYSCGGLETKKLCLAPTPYCQSGGCIECQYNNDCSVTLPKSKCTSETTGTNYTLNKARCSYNKCDFSTAGTPFNCIKASGQTSYCKDNNGKLSCVQCLKESHCAYLNKPLTYGCNGNILFKYWATCEANNKCNTKGKTYGEVDCSQYKYNNGHNTTTLNLSCLAKQNKCGCTATSQCAKIPDKPSTCISNNQYLVYNKVCDKNNDCGYQTSTETCGADKVCFAPANGSGAKCVACQQNSDCLYLGQKDENRPLCRDKTFSTFHFTCQMTNNNPETSICKANRTDNVCFNGCYTDSQGRSLCKDCYNDSECTKAPQATCAANRKSGVAYASQGYCGSDRLCHYQETKVTCNDIKITSYCKSKTVKTVTGPWTNCVTNGSTASCKPMINDERCNGCQKSGDGTICWQ